MSEWELGWWWVLVGPALFFGTLIVGGVVCGVLFPLCHWLMKHVTGPIFDWMDEKLGQ